MAKLIVNADDFGYSAGINYGIIECHIHGIVNSATMMMNMSGTNHAIELAKQFPSLKVGIHLVLTCGKPLLNHVPSLVDKEGNFKSLSHLMNDRDIDLDELEREWTAQIDAFYQAGLTPNHFDSHHHVHGFEEFYPVVKSLSEKYGLPVRKTGHIANLPYYSDVFFDDFYSDNVSESYFEALQQRVENDQTIEIMTHPGFIDHEILNGSSYNLQRVKETYILTNTQLPKFFSLL